VSRKLIWSVIAVLAVAAGALFLTVGRDGHAPSAVAASVNAPEIAEIGAHGRIEPLSEEIRVTAEIPGRLESVPVEEGDNVRAGQIVAVLFHEEYQARLQSAEAEVKLKEAERRRVLNGARDQERREGRILLQETNAVLENARAEMLRRQSLFRTSDISRSEMERVEREYAVAQARHDSAREHAELIEAGPREEDRSQAEAAVELAKARVREAQALLAKTEIRSPISGVVLHKHLKAGESVTGLTEMQPVLTVADASRLRVRAEVDEADVARVRLGQRAWVTASAYGAQKFQARVVRVARAIGRKNIRTDDPAEHVDTKVLEVLLDLDKGVVLAVGLRVDAYIVSGKAGQP
jgi:HlyD family secretion protein